MIAALFVETNGCYYGLPDVDPWDRERDARLYAGPHAVVAHPPCERWGRYWGGGPSVRTPKKLGDDDGCFASALASVRRWGGVLEHPEASRAWSHFALMSPLRGGGWSLAGDGVGWTCCVDQGDYGHRARKATWLYGVGIDPPSLIWHSKRRGSYVRLDDGYYSTAERERGKKHNGTIERLSKKQRAATPIPFRDLLLSIARTARGQERAA